MLRKYRNQKQEARTRRQRHKRRTLPFEVLEARMVLSAISLVEQGPAGSQHGGEAHYDRFGNEYHWLPLPTDAGGAVAATGADAAGAASLPPTLADTFFLHSNPGASKTIYLDFNGHTTTGTYWNSSFNGGQDIVTPAYSFSGDASFTDSELTRIQAIWQRVAEDFIPFDVNVTTEEPQVNALIKNNNNDSTWGVRMVIGGSSSWFGSAGGVAYIGSFTWNSDTPAFVFEDNLGNGNEKYTAEAISHEAGHALGLNHDGRTSPTEEYFAGYGSGATGWAPIMGNSYYKSLTQWSRGEYSASSNQEDDLSIITSRNGFGYRPDDHGDTRQSATTLVLNQGVISGNGIIERNTDFDYFSISTGAGNLSLEILPFERSPNLDIAASLFDAAGSLIVTSNPLNALSATISATLAAGQYYVSVTGVGQGNPASGGYSDYGSLGSYSLSGTFLDNSVGKVFANDDTANVAEDSGTTRLDVLVNDTHETGGPLLISAVGSGSNGGTLTIFNGTAIDYRPAPNFFGQETFTYTLTDGNPGNEATATVTVTVSPVNDAPTAQDDSYSVAINATRTLDVLINDTILPDSGETLTITSVSAGSAGGSLSIIGGQSIQYTPTSGFSGQETFTYSVNDGTPGSNDTATVTVNVQDSSQSINFNVSVIGSYAGSQDAGGIASVEDAGATLHITGNSWKQIAFPYQVTADTILEFDFRSPAQGEVHGIGFDNDLGLSEGYFFKLYGTQAWGNPAFNNYASSVPDSKHYQIPVGQYYTGSFAYLFFGNDHDVANPTAEGYFSNVRVYEDGAVPVNNPPVAVADAFTVVEDSGSSALNVLGNDTTDAGETLTITSTGAGSSGGTITIVGGTSISYQPAADFFGTETFTYTINDGTIGNNATATVTVNVSAQADVVADSATTSEDTPVTINVLANDGFSGTPLVTAVTQGTNGTVVINADGTVTYSPKADFHGSDSFSYSVTAGGLIETATVDMAVTAIADVVTDVVTTTEETLVTINVLSNDGFSGTAQVTGVTQGTSGTVAINADGTLTYAPAKGFIGQDTFSYTVTSGGTSETGTVTVTVQPVIQQSSLNFNDYAIGSYAGSQDVSGIANVEDSGATLHLTGNSWKQIAFPYQVTADTILEFDFRSPAQGEVHGIGFDNDLGLSEGYFFKLYGTQAWGNPAFNNYASSVPDSKHYQIPVGQYYTGSFAYLFFGNDHDVANPTAEGYFSNVRVYEDGAVPVNNPPVAVADAFTVVEDSGSSALNVLGNDTTDAGETLTITSTGAGSSGGTITIVGGTSISYQPAADFFGTETFTYTINDGTIGNNATATVTVNVSAQADVVADSATTSEDTPVTINVLANDGFSGTPLVTAVTQGTNGTVVINADGTVTYTPIAGFTGQDSFSYTATSGAISETSTVTISIEATIQQSSINFNDVVIGSYGGSSQDIVGTATAEDGGATLHLTGNNWKQIAFPYQVTANTILEFDFRSPAQGEVHGIGFDNDLGLSEGYFFKLYGTQAWGNSTFNNYSSSSPNWKHYQIPVGQFYTGSFAYLFFGNDHDVANPTAEGFFANVRVYETGGTGVAGGSEIQDNSKTRGDRGNDRGVIDKPRKPVSSSATPLGTSFQAQSRDAFFTVLGSKNSEQVAEVWENDLEANLNELKQ